LWRQFESDRQAGTPEVQPILDGGRTVRWFSCADDFSRPASDWDFPRVGYLQHPSDAVVWWDWSLLFRQPDWLKEPPGYDVNPAMQWYPIVTFFQVLIDEATATTAPLGHGHNYENAFVGGLDAILSSDLPAATVERIQDEIDKDFR
jgi:uncharacterized membrane protein